MALQTYIALLRGINVGGNNKVPMAELRKIASNLGWQNIATYIASGNMIFDAEASENISELSLALNAEVQVHLGVDVPILILCAPGFRNIAAQNPFQPDDPKHAHIWFLFDAPNLDTDRLDHIKAPDEALNVTQNAAYLDAPSGIGRSKLAEQMSKVLGVDATARNLRTVYKLIEMLDARG